MNTATRVLLAVSAASGFLANTSINEEVVEATGVTPVVAVQDDAEPTPLEASMGVLRGGQRALRKLIKDPEANKGQLLSTLAEMESAAHASIVLKPKAMEGVSRAELPGRMVAYKQGMTNLLVHILAMEGAAIRGDKAGLDTAYKAISDSKQSGHENFRDQ